MKRLIAKERKELGFGVSDLEFRGLRYELGFRVSEFGIRGSGFGLGVSGFGG
jgi:hypothetical protein